MWLSLNELRWLLYDKLSCTKGVLNTCSRDRVQYSIVVSVILVFQTHASPRGRRGCESLRGDGRGWDDFLVAEVTADATSVGVVTQLHTSCLRLGLWATQFKPCRARLFLNPWIYLTCSGWSWLTCLSDCCLTGLGSLTVRALWLARLTDWALCMKCLLSLNYGVRFQSRLQMR